MRRTLTILILVFCQNAFSLDTAYKIEFDYPGHGDDWYGHRNIREPRMDYVPYTDIKTQQGDDFCLGYEPKLVQFEQGPELVRTQKSNGSYDFYRKGGSRCIRFESLPDDIFLDGFEGT